ncbi:MAG TPA: WecB/TagA/CpsF family glycosyltransferase, partial [Caldisericia bacterium]|nr:WecB/TagA/CpsF family glycosyltransferase [Caldisericia bacterium]
MNETGNFIRGLRWHIGDLDGAADRIANLLNDNKINHIITTNMEILSMAFKNKELRELCTNADMHIPDGIGTVRLLNKIGYSKTQRIPGIELCLEALKKMPEGTKIYLFGAREGIARKALENLSLQFLHLVFVGSHEGFGYEDSKLVKEINNSGAQVLLVALG